MSHPLIHLDRGNRTFGLYCSQPPGGGRDSLASLVGSSDVFHLLQIHYLSKFWLLEKIWKSSIQIKKVLIRGRSFSNNLKWLHFPASVQHQNFISLVCSQETSTCQQYPGYAICSDCLWLKKTVRRLFIQTKESKKNAICELPSEVLPSKQKK